MLAKEMNDDLTLYLFGLVLFDNGVFNSAMFFSEMLAEDFYVMKAMLHKVFGASIALQKQSSPFFAFLFILFYFCIEFIMTMPLYSLANVTMKMS